MEDLSFGEQVKIILSRKGMTIKELAEQIEATTKKKMSRQNLTQRLGRDNFQEKDMRMIAAILGCPFQLSIFPLENGAGEKAEPMEELLLKYVKHPKAQPKKKKDDMEDGYYQQVLVFDQDSPGIAASDADADGAAALDAGVPGMMSDADRESVSDAGAAGAMADTDRESSSDADAQDKAADPGREAVAPAGAFDPFAEDSDFDEDDDLLEIDILDPEDSEDLDEADLLYGGFKTKRIDRAAILAAARKAEEEKWDAITGTRDRNEEARGQELRSQGTAAEAADGAEENHTSDALRQSGPAERINAAGEERRPEAQGAGTDHSTEPRGSGADRSTEARDAGADPALEIPGAAVDAESSVESQYQNDVPKDASGDREASGTKEQDFDRKAAEEKEPTAAEERDLTIGELYMIHKELDELEETLHPRADVSMEVPAQAAPTDPEPIYAAGQEEPEEDPEPEDFEPVIRYEDAEENLELGEMNPYTGREYQTNSVRMHPSRIGYVQVYDRFQHGWTDMTEWAFLGYQERKKTLLGRDYEPPIYLD